MTQPQRSLALVMRITLFSGIALLVSGAVLAVIGIGSDPPNTTLGIAGLVIAGLGLIEALTSLVLRVAVRAGQVRDDGADRPPGML